jgi:hypothetical protein
VKVRTVEVEFTEDTFGPDGDVRRSKGDRVYVDQMSAHSFVDIKKVARVPKRKKAAEPEIPPATTEELAPDEPVDEPAGAD